MTRVAIYARYSSDNQREASIDDQLRECRAYAAVQGWEVTQTYTDAAQSGTNAFRPQYSAMLADARQRRFDVVLGESLDRLSRNLGDTAKLHEELQFHGIRLVTKNEGEITPLHIGLLGTMNQQFIKELAAKTKRGQRGRVEAGRVAGGLAYGYEVVAPRETGRAVERGERRIRETEAAIVRRIFEEFAGGFSPREIATRLNREGIHGPGGRPWRDTSIRGQVERGTGILNNRAYIGQIVWDRCSYVKDPRSGKRVARARPEADWVVVEAPGLRIVDDELWAAVKQRQAEIGRQMACDAAGTPLNRARRQKHLLTGLLHCGCCDGFLAITAASRYGCATNRASGTCDNNRTLKRDEIEERVLAGLKEKLCTPELIKEFLEEFQAEMTRLRQEARQGHAIAEKELAKVTREIASMIEAIKQGLFNSSMKAEFDRLEARKADLEHELAASAEANDDTVILFRPNLPELYRQKIAELHLALTDDRLRRQAIDLLRSMIEKVIVTPELDGFKVELYGELGALLQLAEDRKAERPGKLLPGRSLSVVAGAGSNLHLLPEQVKMVAGTGIDHNLQSTPVKMVAGGCNHHYLRPTNSHFPINAKSNAGRMVAKNSSFHSVLFRTAA